MYVVLIEMLQIGCDVNNMPLFSLSENEMDSLNKYYVTATCTSKLSMKIKSQFDKCSLLSIDDMALQNND